MENPITRIASKFQYKFPSLRTLAVMRGRPHRNSYTFLLKSWSRKAAVVVNTFLRPNLRNWYWKTFSGKLLLLLLDYSCCCCSCCRWWYLLLGLLSCPPTIHFKFITKCDTFFYYKAWGSVTRKCNKRYDKVRYIGITKCDRTDVESCVTCKIFGTFFLALHHQAAFYDFFLSPKMFFESVN